MSDRPDFVLVGAMRAGSSSLNRYLADHPGVFMAREKEVHYFDLHYDRGPAWYAERFADAPPGALTGESTPAYWVNEKAMTRLVADLPHARCLLTLRHPVDRAYSHYWMKVREGKEKRSWDAVVAAYLARLAEGFKKEEPWIFRHSRYARHLDRLFRLVPAERCLVVQLEDFERDPERVFRRVCGFLGVPADPLPPTLGLKVNAAFKVRSERVQRWFSKKRVPRRLANLVARFNQAPLDYPAMSRSSRKQLEAAFAADIAAAAAAVSRTGGDR